MQIDLLRRLTPSATLVGEVADQFLVLGIDTDDRIACAQELLSHTTNSQTFGMHCARQVPLRPILYACARSRDASHPFLFICREIVDDSVL